MATKTQICNVALGLLGVAPIADFDTTQSPVAEYCRSSFGPAMREAIAHRSWAFCSRWSGALAQLVNDHPFYTYKFRLPTDLVKVNTVRDVNSRNVEHESDGEFLYANTDVVYVNYCYEKANLSVYPPMFLSGLHYLLASYLAGPLQADTNAIMEFRNTAFVLLDQATDPDVASRSPHTQNYDSGDFLASFGGTTSGGPLWP